MYARARLLFPALLLSLAGCGDPGTRTLLISAVRPSEGPSSGGNAVTIEGAGFDSSSNVFFGDAPSPVVELRDPSTLRAVAPAHAAGKVTIEVRNASGEVASVPDAYLFTDASDAGLDGGTDGGQFIRRITSIAIEPTSLDLTMDQVVRVYARATYNDGTESDISSSVTWTVDPPGVIDLEVVPKFDEETQATIRVAVVKPYGVGTATVSAHTGSVSAPQDLVANVLADPTEDAGATDAGATDAGGTNDSGTPTDAGSTDAGNPDAGTPDAGSSDAGQPTPEFRAVWVTRFAYANSNPVTSRNNLVGIINRAADAGFNVVYFQIRGEGDAYYRSDLAPWAKGLTGTLGRAPKFSDGGIFDPLQIAIDTAHARGIELHAYWNVFSGWRTPSGCKTTATACRCVPQQDAGAASCVLPDEVLDGGPQHILRQHPEYLAVTTSGESIDQEYYWLSPGNPAVRAHLVAVADELLTRYDVDGFHLDRIRYPGQTYSHDAVSAAEYAALPGQKPTYAEWQRQNVTQTVSELYEVMKLRRPNAVMSASVWGIYRPLTGCSTSQGWGNYYQDSVKWMDAGVIDAITPMIYWDIGTGCTDWAKLLDGFLAHSYGRPVIAGMHALEADDSLRINRINARVNYARQHGAAGTSVFASTYLEADGAGSALPDHPEAWSMFRADGGVYAKDAPTPAIDWR